MSFVKVEPDPDFVQASLATDNPEVARRLRSHRRWQVVRHAAIVGGATGLSVPLAYWLDLPGVVVAPAAAASATFLSMRAIRRRERRMRAVLIENRICVGCGYDCVGIEGDRCPECGEGLG